MGMRDEPLSNLVGTGTRSAGIAKKLTEMGYTNSKGGVFRAKDESIVYPNSKRFTTYLGLIFNSTYLLTYC